jgi:hypothetical protein
MPTRATQGRSKATDSDTKSEGLEIQPEEGSCSTNRTRSGRVSKPPERYEPVEQVEDDYGPEDYDSDESDIMSDDSFDEDEDDEDDEDDADEDGNLDGFVVPDKSESGDSDSEDGEPAVPVKKQRTVVKKRATTRK